MNEEPKSTWEIDDKRKQRLDDKETRKERRKRERKIVKRKN